MSDDAKGSEAKKSDLGLDLSALDELSLGPKWVSGKVPSSQVPRSRGSDRSGPRSSGPRPPRRSNERRSRRDGDDGGNRTRPERGSFDRKERGRGRSVEREEVFEPVLKADFYPEEAPYTALANAIRTSCRTYELFEIARLILEKPERWVCVAKHPEQQAGEPAIMSASVPDGLPFLSEQAAIDHTLSHYLDNFCTVEEVEVDAPAGTFQMIHKCGVTGELLAPPNYHKYTSIVRAHHQRRVSGMPFERFQSKLEAVRDEESIAAWLEKMKKRNRYTLKVAEGEEAKVFNDFDDLRLHLMTTAREKLVRPAYSVRVVGKDLHLLPKGDILRRSIETLHEQQLKFPLETANNLRSRLRRTNFHLYKKGSKGISYVCAVKRRFRLKNEVLSENLSDLISFLEAHPNIKAASLPHSYLGIGEKEEKEKAKPTEPAKAESAETEATQAPEEAVASPAVEATPGPKESVEKVTEVVSKEDPQLKSLRRDLHYLVSQGYVVEYSDGRLFALPVRDDLAEEKSKDAKKSKAKPAKSKEKPVTSETKEAVAPVEALPVSEATESEAVAPVETEASASSGAEIESTDQEPEVTPIEETPTVSEQEQPVAEVSPTEETEATETDEGDIEKKDS